MRYRGKNLVENSINEGCRGWDLEDIAGNSLTEREKRERARARERGGGQIVIWILYLNIFLY
jgi:hypothetical protein